MRLRGLPGFLFFLYCVEAGVFLVLAPWSESWPRFVLFATEPILHEALLMPVVRGAISGFGLIHLVWSANDLDGWLNRRRLPHDLAS